MARHTPKTVQETAKTETRAPGRFFGYYAAVLLRYGFIQIFINKFPDFVHHQVELILDCRPNGCRLDLGLAQSVRQN